MFTIKNISYSTFTPLLLQKVSVQVTQIGIQTEVHSNQDVQLQILGVITRDR